MILLAEGPSEENRPEVVEHVDNINFPDTFGLEAARRGVCVEIHAEERLPHFTQASREVGVFTVKRDGAVEPADLFYRGALRDEISAQNHVPHDVVRKRRHVPHRIQDPNPPPRTSEIPSRTAQGYDVGPLTECLLYGVYPLWCDVRVGVNVRDELSLSRLKSGLPRGGEGLLRLEDNACTVRARGFPRLVGRRIIDDHYLAQFPARVFEDDIQGFADTRLFVVRGNDKCEVHSVYGRYFSNINTPRFMTTKTYAHKSGSHTGMTPSRLRRSNVSTPVEMKKYSDTKRTRQPMTRYMKSLRPYRNDDTPIIAI